MARRGPENLPYPQDRSVIGRKLASGSASPGPRHREQHHVRDLVRGQHSLEGGVTLGMAGPDSIKFHEASSVRPITAEPMPAWNRLAVRRCRIARARPPLPL